MAKANRIFFQKRGQFPFLDELSVRSSFSKRLSSLLCERWCNGDDREMVLPLPGLTTAAAAAARTVEADPAAIRVDTDVAAEAGLFTC